MITEKDLQEAIAECQGVRNPNANTCLKLAAFYTILDHVQDRPEEPVRYSFQPPQISTAGRIEGYGDTEFLTAIEGREPEAVWMIMDELMSTLQVLNPRLYDGVMRKIAE